MKPRRELHVASEGIPFLLGLAAATIATAYYWEVRYAAIPLALFVVLLFVFRDPARVIPADPLGVVSPVDGIVLDAGTLTDGLLDGSADRIRIRVDTLGAYTARCPVEGKVMELHRLATADGAPPVGAGGLWIRTDEGEDVVVQFHGNRLHLAPRAFAQYGERVGQGERCAWLRLTRVAEVQFPANGRLLVAAGQRVLAGSTLLARLPHH